MITKVLFAASIAFSTVALGGGDRLVVGAAGDSVSTGFNSEYLGNNKSLSWSTGGDKRVNSHFQRYAALYPDADVKAVNAAVPLSTVNQLGRQVSKLLKFNPDYVTVAIGANDVCSWKDDYETELQAFSEELYAQVTALVESKASIKVALIPIPDLYNLWQVAHKKPFCQLKWDLGICPALLSRRANDESRAAFVVRTAAANAAIAKVAAAYPDSVLFNPEVADTKFEWAQLSPIDCFHPSIDGLNLIADKTWELEGE